MNASLPCADRQTNMVVRRHLRWWASGLAKLEEVLNASLSSDSSNKHPATKFGFHVEHEQALPLADNSNWRYLYVHLKVKGGLQHKLLVKLGDYGATFCLCTGHAPSIHVLQWVTSLERSCNRAGRFKHKIRCSQAFAPVQFQMLVWANLDQGSPKSSPASCLPQDRSSSCR